MICLYLLLTQNWLPHPNRWGNQKLVLRDQVMPPKSQGWNQGGAKAQVSRLQVVLTLPMVGRFLLSWPSIPLPWDRICRIQSTAIWASQVALLIKNPPANVFDLWVRNIPWRTAWQPTPVFLPENPMDRGAWWATVHGITKSWTWLSDLACMHACTSSLFQLRIVLNNIRH